MSEEKKIIEYIKKEYGNFDNYVRDLLDLYQKEKEKNRELLKERAGYAEEYIHNNPWLYKQLDELYIFRGEVDRKYISKDKIREKIEEYKKSKKFKEVDEYGEIIEGEIIYKDIVEALQELLEEE